MSEAAVKKPRKKYPRYTPYKPTGNPVGRPKIDAGNDRADFHIYLTAKQDRWLRQQAHNARRTRSSIVREWIDEKIAQVANGSG